jgi:hypothetical protein
LVNSLAAVTPLHMTASAASNKVAVPLQHICPRL